MPTPHKSDGIGVQQDDPPAFAHDCQWTYKTCRAAKIHGQVHGQWRQGWVRKDLGHVMLAVVAITLFVRRAWHIGPLPCNLTLGLAYKTLNSPETHSVEAGEQ